MTVKALAVAAFLWGATATGAAAPDEPLRAWLDVPNPTKRHSSPPRYPAIAAQARVQGLVILRVTVGADGRPTDMKVERGMPGFDDPVMSTVRTWQYEPTLVEGTPRRVIVYEPFLFLLNGSPARYVTRLADGKPSKDHLGLSLKLWAVSTLQGRLGTEADDAAKGLQKFASDPDERVANAARTALSGAEPQP